MSTPKCFLVCISLNIRRSELLPLLWRLTLGTWFISIKCFLFSGKCSADATALHFTVAVFCTYTSPIPCSLAALAASILRWFCLWLGLLVLDPFTHQLGTAPWTITLWGGSKYYPTVALILIALKSYTLGMQIRTRKGHTHTLHHSWSLRSHPWFVVKSTSDWVTVPCSPTQLNWSGDGSKGWVRRSRDAYETSHGLFSWVGCA